VKNLGVCLFSDIIILRHLRTLLEILIVQWHLLYCVIVLCVSRYHSWEMLCGHYQISVGTRIHPLLSRLFSWVCLHSVDFFITLTMMCLVSKIALLNS